MSKESPFRRKICKHLRSEGFFVQPIESGGTAEGIPDLWYCGQGIEGWIELKYVKQMPKRTTTSVFTSLSHPLSKEQEVWIETAYKKGARVHILVGYGREMSLIPAQWIRQINFFNEIRLRGFTVNKDDLINRLKL